MAAIALVAGDTGSLLRVTVKNKDGTSFNGTGASVKLNYTIDGGTRVQRTMQVVQENPLKVEYQFVADDLPAPSSNDPDQIVTMRAEIEVTDSENKVTTQLVPFRFPIRAKV